MSKLLKEIKKDDFPSREDHAKAYDIYNMIVQILEGQNFKIAKLAISKIEWNLKCMEMDLEDEKKDHNHL